MTGPVITYAITDRHLFAGDERERARSLVAQAVRLHAAGISFLQLREKDLSPAALLDLAAQVRRVLAPGSLPRLLLNGPANLAPAAGADGLHLPGGWTLQSLREARRSLGPASPSGGPPVLSVAAHTPAEVQAAREADLILFGPVFGKQVGGTAVAPGVGLDSLREACAAAGGVPVLALGGVTPANRDACLAAGAAGVAGIRLFLSSADGCVRK